LENQGLLGDVSEGSFIAMLVCNYAFCGEAVTVAGFYRSDTEVAWGGEEGDQAEEITSYSYKPYSIKPAPLMIDEPNADSKKHLRKAYELFWNDYASCANRLRIVVEYLLDQLGIAREGPKGKRKKARLDLADRIAILALAKPDYDEALTALRYVGNAGSHEGVGEFEDIMDCFDLLEHAMIELIEQRREKLAEKAKRIIAAKGKPQG